MSMDDVIRLLQHEYERGKKNPYVQNPLAWALYKVWKVVDAAGESRISVNTKRALEKLDRAVHSREETL